MLAVFVKIKSKNNIDIRIRIASKQQIDEKQQFYDDVAWAVGLKPKDKLMVFCKNMWKNQQIKSGDVAQ